MKAPDVHVEEIGRQRFAAALPKLRALVRGASFVAIDTEMGGLSLQDCRPSMMDSVQERYEQFRATAQQFPVVQFGLSAFTWDAAARRFDVESFQFPIFPRFAKIEASELPDRRFLMQPRCLQYIRDHGFDLNSWIDDGVSYLSHADQAQFRGALAQSAQPEVLRKFDPRVPAVITADTREFLQDITKKIKKRFAAQRGGTSAAPSAGRGKSGRRDTRTRRSQQQRRGRDERQELDDDGAAEAAAGADEQEPDCVEMDEQQQESARIALSPAELRSARKFFDANVESDLKGKYRADWPTAVFLSEPLAPFRRHVLLQHLEKNFTDVLAFDCKADNSGEDVQQNPWKRRVRLVAASSAREKQCLVDAYELNSQQELRDRNLELIGFTELMDVLVTSKKPLVGHNLLLDLMQCFEKFHEPLPSRCSEFLHELNAWTSGGGSSSNSVDGDREDDCDAESSRPQLRGGIYDTKEMVTYAMETLDMFANNLHHSALETVFEALSKTPFHGAEIHIKGSPPPPSLSSSASSSAGNGGGFGDRSGSKSPQQRPKQRVQAHQAGYDAFMTGFVFLRVCSGLGIPNSAIAELGGHGEESSSSSYQPNDRLLQFRNVLHVSHFLPAHTLQVPGPFPDEAETPSRACFLRLHLVRTSSSGSLKNFHIKQCICWALNLASPKQVQVYWEGKQWVYVALPTPEHAEELLRLREDTSECEGNPNDPMPSVGCVDIYRCASLAPTTAASEGGRVHSLSLSERAADDLELEAEKKQVKRRK